MAGTRTKRQREADKAFEIPLWLKGYDYRHIARALKEERKRTGSAAPAVSHVTVWTDIKGEIQRWREERLDDVEQMQLAELERIAQLEREYWDAWERSKAEFMRSTQEQMDAGDEKGRRKVAVTKEQRTGDARYLEGVQWCVRERCKILGLYAPEKTALTDPSGQNEYQAGSDEQLKVLLERVCHRDGDGDSA